MPNGLGMGGHQLPNEGMSKIWLTPPEILAALGHFDLDPCAAPEPRPWATADKHYDITQGDDGLLLPWEGRVFMNPPYDQQMGPWLSKLADHGSGVALIFARTETEMWHRQVWEKAHSILFLEGRLFFFRPDGVRAKHNSGAPSALVSYSEADTEVLKQSRLRGCHVMLKGKS